MLIEQVPLWQESAQLFRASLAGMAQPWLVATALVLTTLLLEDVAIAAGVALASMGTVSWELSFAAVAGGIALGDMGLYALGLAARRLPRLRRRFIDNPRSQVPARMRERLQRSLASAVLMARVIPGLRLVTYTACGFLHLPLLPFTLWVALAVMLWTAGLFALSSLLGHALAMALGLPLPVAVALPIIVFALAFPLAHHAWQRARWSTS